MSSQVRSERRDAVALLVLDGHPAPNPIGSETLNQLAEAVGEAGADPSVRAIVVAGAGRSLSAGADLQELGRMSGPAAFRDFITLFTRTLDVLAHCPKPSVAAIEGVAYGGGLELALACDIRVAGRDARLGLPEVRLGLLPGAGGTARLPRLLPSAVARHLLLTGDALDALRAHAFGLVAELADGGEALAAALALAGRLAAGPPLALAAAKRLVDEGASVDLDAAVALERDTVTGLFGSADAKEGVAAFLAKRRPAFTGH